MTTYLARDYYISDGVHNQFAVSFAYISEAHVAVYINGAPYLGSVTWINNSLIQIATPASGAVVEVIRQTPIVAMQTVIQTGEMSAQDINAMALQLLYLTQEDADAAAYALAVANGDPIFVNPQDSATGFIWAGQFGVVPGIVDMVAMQRLADYATARSALVWFPLGEYRINGPILIRPPGSATDAVGFGFIGAGGDIGTRIVQTADNEPIFDWQIPGNCHSVVIKGFWFDWATAADPSKTNRNVVRMAYPGSGNPQFYNSRFDDWFVKNCHYAVYSSASIWGLRWTHLFLSDSSGGALNAFATVPQGSPRNHFDDHYVLANGMAGPIYYTLGFSVKMGVIEINSADQGPQLINDVGGCLYTIGHFRIEGGAYTTATVLFQLANGILLADVLEVTTLNISAPIYLIGFQTYNPLLGTAPIKLAIYAAPTITGSGAFFLCSADASNGNQNIPNLGAYFEKWIHTVPLSNTCAVADNFASTGPDGVFIESWNSRSRMNFLADADAVIPNDAAAVQIAFVPLTADRTYTLPEQTGSNNNAFSGREIEFVKMDATGVGQMVLAQGGGHLAIIPANMRGRVRFRYNRSVQQASGLAPVETWMIVAFELWPAGASAPHNSGRHVVTSGEATAMTLFFAAGVYQDKAFGIQIMRAGAKVMDDAAVSYNSLYPSGYLIVANGATYALTAGDIINWWVDGA